MKKYPRRSFYATPWLELFLKRKKHDQDIPESSLIKGYIYLGILSGKRVHKKRLWDLEDQARAKEKK